MEFTLGFITGIIGFILFRVIGDIIEERLDK